MNLLRAPRGERSYLKGLGLTPESSSTPAWGMTRGTAAWSLCVACRQPCSSVSPLATLYFFILRGTSQALIPVPPTYNHHSKCSVSRDTVAMAALTEESKHVTGACLQFQKRSLLSSWWGAWQHAGWPGAREVAERGLQQLRADTRPGHPHRTFGLLVCEG